MNKAKAEKVKRCLEKNGIYRMKDGSEICVRENYLHSKEYVLYGKDHGIFNHNVIDTSEDIDDMLEYLSDN